MALGRFLQSILYDSGGHTGNTYYFQIIDQSTGYTWDDTNSEMAENPNWADAAITMTEIGTSGKFPLYIPAGLPKGKTYDLIVYQQAGGSPANTDDVENQSTYSIGSIFGF